MLILKNDPVTKKRPNDARTTARVTGACLVSHIPFSSTFSYSSGKKGDNSD